MNLPGDIGSAYPPTYYSYRPPADRRSQGVLRQAVLDAASRLSRHGWWRWLVPILFSPDHFLAAIYADPRTSGTAAVGSPPAVLDIGCGWGKALDVYRATGFRTVGVELSEAAAQVARDRGHQVVFSDAVDRLDDEFAVVRSTHTIEHVEDPLAMVAAMTAHVAPSGRIFIEVPNATGLVARVFGRYWAQIDPPRHLAIPSAQMLVATLKESGFDVSVDTCTMPKVWTWSLSIVLARYRGPRTTALPAGLGRAMRLASLLFVLPSLLADWLRIGDNLRIVATRRAAAQVPSVEGVGSGTGTTDHARRPSVRMGRAR